VDIRGLIGLLGVLIAAVVAEFNDQVTSVALADIQGGLRISHDPGTWFGSLYISAEIVGMAISPWMLVTFTLRRWTLSVIGLSCLSTVLIPFSPNVAAVYISRSLQGLAGGLTIPLLMATALRVLPPPIRLYGLAVYALTATFTPSLADSLAGLWTDVVHDWRFVFFEAIPLCAMARRAGLVRRAAGSPGLRSYPHLRLGRDRREGGPRSRRHAVHHAIEVDVVSIQVNADVLPRPHVAQVHLAIVRLDIARRSPKP